LENLGGLLVEKFEKNLFIIFSQKFRKSISTILCGNFQN
jgi:hypothetical protein